MATNKYDPEKDFAAYHELAKELDNVAEQIAKLIEKSNQIKQKVDEHLHKAQQDISFDVIKAAAHEFQVEMLNEITRAVIEANDLEKAVRLIDHLETHLEARLRLSLKMQGKELPARKIKKDATPTVSPTVAAKKSIQIQEQKKSPQPSGNKTQLQATKKPSAPPSFPSGPVPAGKIVERRTLLNDKVNEICRYEYENNKLSRILFLDSSGSPLRTHQMIYDKNGTLVQEIHIDRSGVTLQVFDRELDKNGKITKEITRNSKNETLNTVEFTYDRKNRLVKKQWRDSRGNKTKVWEYKFDKDAKEPSRIIWKDERNKPYGFVELRYDDKGHIIEETSKDRSGDLIRSIKYQYFYG